MKVLIAGGAGFIGGTTAQLFVEAGHKVVIIDNLSTGHRHNVPGIELIEMDVGDIGSLKSVLDAHHFDAALQFAAKIRVEESMEHPLDYLQNNAFASAALIDGLVASGIKNIIFSSTGSVYGEPKIVPIPETAPTHPINPYALSKRLTEEILHSYQLTGGLNWTAFRYFNAAGAYGRIGPEYPVITHLIPSLLQAIDSGRPFTLYGDDYDTPDGTSIRDYIHVHDIARAHVTAAERMAGGAIINQPVNLGSSQGYSVKEVLAMVERVTDHSVDINDAPRRPGDASRIIADNKLAGQLFDWRPEHNLESIVKDAYAWQQAYA